MTQAPYPDLPERAISIRQPWIWAILYAGKDIENRPRRWGFRGPICLHASASHIIKDQIEAEDFMARIGARLPPGERSESIDPAEMLEFGGIIGTAEVVDCVESSGSPWFMGRYGLILANVKPVPFIPVKGALGAFNWRGRVMT